MHKFLDPESNYFLYGISRNTWIFFNNRESSAQKRSNLMKVIPCLIRYRPDYRARLFRAPIQMQMSGGYWDSVLEALEHGCVSIWHGHFETRPKIWIFFNIVCLYVLMVLRGLSVNCLDSFLDIFDPLPSSCTIIINKFYVVIWILFG